MRTNKKYRSIFYKAILASLGKMFDDVTDEPVSMRVDGRTRVLISDGLYTTSTDVYYITDGMVEPYSRTGRDAIYVKQSSYVITVNEADELLLNIVVTPEKLTFKKIFEIRKKYSQIFNWYMTTI